ncbi:MAG: RNA methyltransferase, partial [Ignavibacteria bacterium]|nr:RNA methyltransferase [Ignavibacteria bacterium]
SMGSLLRVPVIETDLTQLIDRHKKIPVYAADMNGTYISKIEKVVPAFIMIGNEGSGLKKIMEPYVNETISIPRKGKAESLNAAVAASIICAMWG